MSVLEAQIAELMQKLIAPEERQERNDAILRELLSTREEAQRRGQETPAGADAEEMEEGGAEAAAASSRLETVAAQRGVSHRSALPISETSDVVPARSKLWSDSENLAASESRKYRFLRFYNVAL